MSVERQARRALWRVAFYRFLGDLIDVPFDAVKAVSHFLGALARLGDKLTFPLFYLELAAAREYRLLTGVDMGVATGDPERYMGTRPEAFDVAVAELEVNIEDDD